MIVLLIFARSGMSQQPETEFEHQFDLLRRQNVSEIGLEAAIKGYQQLIKRHISHPEIGRVYLELASLYSCDSDEGVRYLEEAAKTSKPGGDIWIEAKLSLFSCFKSNTPERAETLLKELEQHVSGDSLNVTKLQAAYQDFHLLQGDFRSAEARCRKLLSRSSLPELPTDPWRRSQINIIIMNSSEYFIKEIALAIKIKRLVRINILRKLAEDFPYDGLLKKRVEDAIAEINRLPEGSRADLEIAKALGRNGQLETKPEDVITTPKKNHLFVLGSVFFFFLCCSLAALHYYKQKSRLKDVS